ncbi:MAG TPA: hypothetical protein VG269_22395 [Tepidisphaeraceae bacterium]|jgi:hypothetical protein|nr:hypothetical protein [Tepidisphaeraceae bacterium]
MQPENPMARHKRVGGSAQTDIRQDIIPPSSRKRAGKGRRDTLEGATGASDASSGAGAGAGIPGGGTDMRTAGRFDKGDVKTDRHKLFPEAKTTARKKGRNEA